MGYEIVFVGGKRVNLSPNPVRTGLKAQSVGMVAGYIFYPQNHNVENLIIFNILVS